MNFASWWRALFAAALFPTGSAPAHAMPQDVQTGLSAVDVFAAADRARAEKRDADALTLYEALTHDPDAEVRAEARFREGSLLAALKRYAAAAVVYRALLDEKPGASRVRLELAAVLAAMGDERAARRELRQARAAGLPDDVAVLVDRFAAALHSARRLGGSLEIALAPDSNINRATASRTLDTIIAPLVLSRNARARSGIGLALAGQGYARIGLSDRLAILPRLSGRANLYHDHDFDDVSGSALLGLEWRVGKDRLAGSIGPTWRWYGGDLYARTATLAIDWLHPLNGRTQLTASVSGGRTRYVRNGLQDGAILDAGLGVERALGRRGGGGASLSATRQTARDAGYATVAGGVSAYG